MKARRRGLAVTALLAAACCAPLEAQAGDRPLSGSAGAPASSEEFGEIDPGYLWIRDLLADDRRLRRQAAERLIARGDRGLVFGIVDALFFIARPFRDEAFEALEKLTGQKPGRSYWEWVELAGRLEEVAPSSGYSHWKAVLFAHLDPRYRRLLDPAAARRLGGAARAYPARRLFAAGVVNDELGGERVLLLADRATGAVRAYRRPPFPLRRGAEPDLLLGPQGETYRATELALAAGSGGGPEGGESYARLPGHFAFFFGWYAFFPQTTVWLGQEEEATGPGRPGGAL